MTKGSGHGVRSGAKAGGLGSNVLHLWATAINLFIYLLKFIQY